MTVGRSPLAAKVSHDASHGDRMSQSSTTIMRYSPLSQLQVGQVSAMWLANYPATETAGIPLHEARRCVSRYYCRLRRHSLRAFVKSIAELASAAVSRTDRACWTSLFRLSRIASHSGATATWWAICGAGAVAAA
jgi:hypothetical protein